MPRPRKPTSPLRYFNLLPYIISLVVMMYLRFPFNLRNVEDLPFDRGIEICFETVRIWWTRFGPEEFCAAPFPLAGDKYRFDCPHRHTITAVRHRYRS